MSSYPTAIGTSDETSISLLGHDLAADLMGKVSFAELAFWLVAQRRPTAGEARVFETVLVALADHGFTPTVIAARMTLTGAPESVQGVKMSSDHADEILLAQADPVGDIVAMAVDPAKSLHHVEYTGHTFHFCSATCKANSCVSRLLLSVSAGKSATAWVRWTIASCSAESRWATWAARW